MIQQPKLGKTIADLRKAKGLTQEDLVEKCNLNVRTLQRIESGEATPRSYTLKLIFEALDYSFDELEKEEEFKLKWPGQFYICFIDLFNLKTKTMKKISILSVMISLVILGVFTVNSKLSAQDNSIKGKEKEKVESSSEKELVFSNFSCFGCMEERGLMIGRDVSFTLSGVKVKNIRLIALDQKNREFNALFIKGKLLERKVEAEYSHDMFIDGNLKYSADEVKKSESIIYLKGNAEIIDLNEKDNPDDDESIQADEIIITLI